MKEHLCSLHQSITEATEAKWLGGEMTIKPSHPRDLVVYLLCSKVPYQC